MDQQTDTHAVMHQANSGANEVVSEKRDEHRRRVLKGGTLQFNNGYASYGCTVRNLTQNGAMVEMGETTGIPSAFDFKMDGLEPTQATIVWRNAKRIGLRFSH